MKLAKGSFEIRTVRDALDDDGAVIGTVRIHRRAGWNGGPHYYFNPNEAGFSRGYKYLDDGSVRGLVALINAYAERG